MSHIFVLEDQKEKLQKIFASISGDQVFKCEVTVCDVSSKVIQHHIVLSYAVMNFAQFCHCFPLYSTCWIY